MSALTLTSSQQKSTLSSKKQLKKNVRNVFASPCSNFWPVCSQTDESTVLNLLHSLLPAVKQATAAIGWNVLRNISRQERREKRQSLQKEFDASNPEISALRKELRKCLLLGVNAVTRAMEHEDICCALISGDVDPRIMVSHVVTLSLIHNIPLLILPSLRTVTHQCLGFSCIVLGMKKNIVNTRDHHFYPLYEAVSGMSLKFSRPKNFQRFFLEETDYIDSDVEKSEIFQEISAVQKPENNYLHRKSKKERVFVPSMEEHNAQMDVTTYFIPLSNGTEEKTFTSSHTTMLPLGYETCSKNDKEVTTDKGINVKTSQRRVPEVKKKSNDVKYLPLIVKKIQPNPNKVKRRKIKKNKKN